MSWNAYPKYVRNSIINRLKSNVNRNDNVNNNNNKDDRKVIWINLPYLGKKGNIFKRNCEVEDYLQN